MAVIATNGLLKAQHDWIDDELQTDPLQILILNLMPTKLETERQFLQRFAAVDQDVAVTFMYPTRHHFKTVARAAVVENYVSIDQVVDQSFDGVIITGAPVEQLPFEDVDYWHEFVAISDWAHRHASQTLYECWAAQAGLYQDFDIPKYDLPQKAFGIYSATTVDDHSPLMSGLSAGGLLKMPQSRHTALDLPAQLPADLQVVAANAEVGPLVLTSSEQRAVYVTGHPEYAADTLTREYHRDRRQHRRVPVPQHYFEQSDATVVNYSWPDASRRFYQNWLASLTLTKVGL